MPAFGRLAYSGIERVAWIESVEERLHCRLRGVQVAHVMLSRILRLALVEQSPHPMLEGQAILSLAHDVVLMEDVTEEVAVVELVSDRILHLGRKRLKPSPVVAPEGDVERDDVLYLMAMDCPVAHGCSGHREAMQECCASFLAVTLEEPTLTRSEASIEETPCFLGHCRINLGGIARSGSSRIRSRVSVQAPSLPG